MVSKNISVKITFGTKMQILLNTKNRKEYKIDYVIKMLR